MGRAIWVLFLDQVVMVPTDEIQMLGVPLGSDEKAAAFVEKKLLQKLSTVVDRLSDFDDIQSAFFLLRTSFSIVRATHFMRTTPRAKWRKQAKCLTKKSGMLLKVSWVWFFLNKHGNKRV